MEEAMEFPIQEFGAKKTASLRSKEAEIHFNKGKNCAWYAFVRVDGEEHFAFPPKGSNMPVPSFTAKEFEAGRTSPPDLSGKDVAIWFHKSAKGVKYASIVIKNADGTVKKKVAAFVPTKRDESKPRAPQPTRIQTKLPADADEQTTRSDAINKIIELMKSLQ